MQNERREFIKKTGLLGMALAGSGIVGHSNEMTESDQFSGMHSQNFNMHGYVVPKLDIVRMAVIGLGNRGGGTVRRLASIEGVEIKALCDVREEKVKKAADMIRPFGQKPDHYTGENDWKTICERQDIDLVAVVTPWHYHTPMCVYAMEHDKHAYTELPAALTLDECWQLVETSERTRKHCIQMSGNCSGGINAVILNMVREGFFGDIVHAEGAYIHDLIPRHMFVDQRYYNNWRIFANIGKSGNLYPQHGLVPIMQMMDINYGDKMDYLVSLSSDDFNMNAHAKKLASEDDYWKQFVGRDYRGNMNTTLIRTNKGRSIMMQHDVSSPRPGVRFDLISGSKGAYKANPGRLADSDEGWFPEEKFDELIEKYTPEINKKFDELVKQAKQIVREQGYYMVSPVDWRIIDCLRSGLPLDMDVYDAAVSSSIIPLSIWSVENRSTSVTVPDFTSGAWRTNIRGMDIQLERGFGNTKLI